MDATNPVIQLCIQGTRAEFELRIDDARRLYQQAWDSCRNDYEACIAAHYVARFQETPEKSLHWNRIALDRAKMVSNEKVKEFFPSLYLALGHSHEIVGNQNEAERYYEFAARLGVRHLPD